MADSSGADTVTEAENVSEAVHLAIGAASTCWENLGGAGVFDSDRASAIAGELVRWIEQHRPAPTRSLGTVFVDVVPRIAPIEGELLELDSPLPNAEDLRRAGSRFAEAARAVPGEVDRWAVLCEGLLAFAGAFATRRELEDPSE